MKIGIIGAGNIGGNLTRRLTALGHDVRVANSRGPETLADLAAETGATAVDVANVADGAELVILSVPQKNVPDLPAGLLDSKVDGAPVIDTNNYYPRERDGRIAAIEDGLTESGWVEQQIAHPVVKAFNGVYAHWLLEKPLPTGSSERLAIPVAGDDPAKATVMALVDELGFDAVDAGPIADSWRMQPGTPWYGSGHAMDDIKKDLAETPEQRPAAFTA